MARLKEFEDKEVLEKAMNTFWQKGYANTSMQDLVDGMGINRASIYLTFGDKQKLFDLALQNYKDTRSKAMIDLLKNSDNIKKTIRQLFQFVLEDSVSTKKNASCFMVNTAVELNALNKSTGLIVKNNLDELEEVLYKAIKKGQKKGDISEKKPAQALAKFILNMINGMRVSSSLKYDKDHYEQIIGLIDNIL